MQKQLLLTSFLLNFSIFVEVKGLDYLIDTGHASLISIATSHQRPSIGTAGPTLDATATITLSDKRLLQHIVSN